jgi:hypothetical protein
MKNEKKKTYIMPIFEKRWWFRNPTMNIAKGTHLELANTALPSMQVLRYN